MPKGQHLAEFEQYVLLSLVRLDEGAYGAAIRRDIEENTGRPVSIGAVYATLGRLADKGLVESWASRSRLERALRSPRESWSSSAVETRLSLQAAVENSPR